MSFFKALIESFFSSEKVEHVGFQPVEDIHPMEVIIEEEELSDITDEDKEEEEVGENKIAPLIDIEEPEIMPIVSLSVPEPSPVISDVDKVVNEPEPVPTRCLSNCNIM